MIFSPGLYGRNNLCTKNLALFIPFPEDPFLPVKGVPSNPECSVNIDATVPPLEKDFISENRVLCVNA